VKVSSKFGSKKKEGGTMTNKIIMQSREKPEEKEEWEVKISRCAVTGKGGDRYKRGDLRE